MKKIIQVLTSLSLSVWVLAALIPFCLAGAFIMPAHEEFQAMQSMPLLDWIKMQPLKITWWLWGIMALLGILTVNTLFCSVDSVIKKRKATQWLLLISPQVIHIGFIFILLAHLMSSIGGFQAFTMAGERNVLELPDGTALEISAIRADVSPEGYVADWSVDVRYISGGLVTDEESIRPNSPSIHGGYLINVKNIQAYPSKAVLLQLSREPGAIWALIGGILFMAGTLALIWLKMRKE